MYIITALVALIQMTGSTLTGNAWTDVFLDKMVGVESFFYNIAWWVWAVVMVIALLMVAAKFLFHFDFQGLGWNCGCMAFVLLIWPLAEWVSLLLVRGLADHFNAAVGVTDIVPFVIYLLLYLSFGAG